MGFSPLSPGKDLNCCFKSEYISALKRKIFHLLKINISEAEALAISRVGDGPVHHPHLLGLHGAGSPRVPAEVVSAAVHVESGRRQHGLRSRPATRRHGRNTRPPVPGRGPLAFRGPAGPEPRVPVGAPRPQALATPRMGAGSSGAQKALRTFLNSLTGKIREDELNREEDVRRSSNVKTQFTI